MSFEGINNTLTHHWLTNRWAQLVETSCFCWVCQFHIWISIEENWTKSGRVCHGRGHPVFAGMVRFEWPEGNGSLQEFIALDLVQTYWIAAPRTRRFPPIFLRCGDEEQLKSVSTPCWPIFRCEMTMLRYTIQPNSKCIKPSRQKRWQKHTKRGLRTKTGTKLWSTKVNKTWMKKKTEQKLFSIHILWPALWIIDSFAHSNQSTVRFAHRT